MWTISPIGMNVERHSAMHRWCTFLRTEQLKTMATDCCKLILQTSTLVAVFWIRDVSKKKSASSFTPNCCAVASSPNNWISTNACLFRAVNASIRIRATRLRSNGWAATRIRRRSTPVGVENVASSPSMPFISKNNRINTKKSWWSGNWIRRLWAFIMSWAHRLQQSRPVIGVAVHSMATNRWKLYFNWWSAVWPIVRWFTTRSAMRSCEMSSMTFSNFWRATRSKLVSDHLSLPLTHQGRSQCGLSHDNFYAPG